MKNITYILLIDFKKFPYLCQLNSIAILLNL